MPKHRYWAVVHICFCFVIGISVIGFVGGCNNDDYESLLESQLRAYPTERARIENSILVTREHLASIIPEVREGAAFAKLIHLFGGQPFASNVDSNGTGLAIWRFYIKNEKIKSVSDDLFCAKFRRGRLIEGAIIPH